ncbi:MAG: radical SAM protein [Defluviitaleaceae bacterium]|nr:radical SAM protein [Defluviitaleaceae bacterium]
MIETTPAKQIVANVTSSDAWFGVNYSMNIYRGCNHGCIYCDSRSDCFRVEDFDKVKLKENALQIIRDDLRRKAKKGVVGVGAMCDIYNHHEASLKITRNALELINAFGFGVATCTKSALITRDIDILADIKAHSPVLAKFSISTADDALCKRLETNVSSPSDRFEAIAKLTQAGIPCGILMMPILPFINDTEDNIRQICRKAKEAGAFSIYPAMGMTLRDGSREHYLDKLESIFPGEGLKERYLKIYGKAYSCNSPKRMKLWAVFREECEKLGLLYDMKAIIQYYKKGYGDSQLTFL